MKCLNNILSKNYLYCTRVRSRFDTFLLSYFLKLLRFLGVIWCLKKDYRTTNYVNKLAENRRFLAAENTSYQSVKVVTNQSVLWSSNCRNKPKNILLLSQFSVQFFLETGVALWKKDRKKIKKTRSDSK